MISFYKDEAGVMFKDDTYLETDMFVIERPATDEDVVAHPDEHTAFAGSITPVQTPAAPTQPDATAQANPDGAM